MGIPCVLITALYDPAKGMNVPRVVQGTAICNATGNPDIPLEEERDFRYKLIKRALNLLEVEGDRL